MCVAGSRGYIDSLTISTNIVPEPLLADAHSVYSPSGVFPLEKVGQHESEQRHMIELCSLLPIWTNQKTQSQCQDRKGTIVCHLVEVRGRRSPSR